MPGRPGTPSATGNSGSIALSWGASSGTVTGYRVYEGTTLKTTVTGTSATVSGLGACESHTYTVAAYNTAGESPKSNTASATTTGCTVGPLPKHFLTGYWQNFDNPAVELKLRRVPNEYDLVAVAFAEATATPGRGHLHASTPAWPPPSAATPTPSSRPTSRRCTRAARRSSSRSAARPGRVQRRPTPTAATNFANTRLRR